jgi:hypothetical protein
MGNSDFRTFRKTPSEDSQAAGGETPTYESKSASDGSSKAVNPVHEVYDAVAQKQATRKPRRLKALRVGAILILAVVGGIIAALSGQLIFPNQGPSAAIDGTSFNWGAVLGPTVAAALTAYLGLRFGIGAYVQKQERDEISRRFVDEGFDRLGRLLTEEFARSVRNGELASGALKMALEPTMPLDVPCHALERLEHKAPVLGFDVYRVARMLVDLDAVMVFGRAYTEMESAHAMFCDEVPEMLKTARDAGKRIPADILRHTKANVDARLKRLHVLRHAIAPELANLSSDFQAAGFTTFEEVKFLPASTVGLSIRDSLRRLMRAIEQIDAINVPKAKDMR